MAITFINRSLTKLGVFAARPWAFLIIIAYTIGWAVFEPHTLDWHAYATLATWAMTLVIQRAEQRDTQAREGSSTNSQCDVGNWQRCREANDLAWL